MADLRHLLAPRRVALALSASLLLGGPASGQGPFPPVPGPFPVMPGQSAAAQMPVPEAPAADQPAADQSAADQSHARARPMFLPPANAMRVPYWMQAPQATGPEAATGKAAQTPAPAGQKPAGAAAPQNRGATGYAQQMPTWTLPGYGGQGYGAMGYGAPMPWSGQPVAPGGPGYGAPQALATDDGAARGGQPGWGNGTGPGWGYGTGPGWGPAPYAPVPGWGWAAPTMGVGQ